MNAPLQADIGRIHQEAPAMWLRRLWERMVAMYGHAWVNVHGVTPHEGTGALSMSGDTWGRTLAGLTAQQIAAGIENCVAEGAEFPPSAPRFRAMCMNVPRLAAVRSELRQGNPSPFTRAVWAELDAYRFKQASADQADRQLRDAYDLTHDRTMRGEPLPEVPIAEIAQEKPEIRPAAPDVAKAHCTRIREMLHGGVQ